MQTARPACPEVREPAALLAVDALDARAVAGRLREEGAFALPVLPPAARERLLAEAAGLGWRPARAVVGPAGREVRQDMEICTGLPAGGAFHQLADAWQALWNRALGALSTPMFEGELQFNDRLLQRYAPAASGITPHRDRIGYRNLVCLFVLCGAGRFCLCEDRAGSGVREIRAVAGDALLMRAPGFMGEGLRPFHFVDRITSTRYVYGLRHAVEPARQQY